MGLHCWVSALDLHMDLFWSGDGQCLGEASDTPMTSGLGGWWGGFHIPVREPGADHDDNVDA